MQYARGVRDEVRRVAERARRGELEDAAKAFDEIAAQVPGRDQGRLPGDRGDFTKIAEALKGVDLRAARPRAPRRSRSSSRSRPRWTRPRSSRRRRTSRPGSSRTAEPEGSGRLGPRLATGRGARRAPPSRRERQTRSAFGSRNPTRDRRQRREAAQVEGVRRDERRRERRRHPDPRRADAQPETAAAAQEEREEDHVRRARPRAPSSPGTANAMAIRSKSPAAPRRRPSSARGRRTRCRPTGSTRRRARPTTSASSICTNQNPTSVKRDDLGDVEQRPRARPGRAAPRARRRERDGEQPRAGPRAGAAARRRGTSPGRKTRDERDVPAIGEARQAVGVRVPRGERREEPPTSARRPAAALSTAGARTTRDRAP